MEMTKQNVHTADVHIALKSPRVNAILFMAMIALILFTALQYVFPGVGPGALPMKDYDAFFVAGRMFWEGRLEDAYFAETLIAAQAEILGVQSFMPWTYPPHFIVVTAMLSLVPVWLGYALFTGLTLLFYLIMLRNITPGLFTVVIIFTFPAALICIRTGQNGFLIAGLIAYFILNIEHSKVRASASLALLSFKPHFLPLMYLLAALRRQTLVILGGLFGTALLLISASLIFGFGIWPAFQNSVNESGIFLREGFYPLFRMTSLYAALHTLGAPPNIAFVAQILLALTAIGAVLLAKIKSWPRHQLLATAVMGSLFISPYAYDYDLQILGVALALLMQDLWIKASAKQLLILLAGCWLSSASVFFSWSEESSLSELHNEHLALNFWFLISICLYSLWIARTGLQHDATRKSRPEGGLSV